VISTVALSLTQNRSGWLALAAALVIWLLTTSAVSEAAAAIVLAAIPSAAAIVVVSRLDLLATSGAGGRAGRAHLAAAVVMLFAWLAAACALLRPRVRIGRRVAVRAAQGGALAVSAALVAAGFHSGDRLHYWRAAVHGIEHHWLLGRGAGTFDEVWFRYRDVGRVVRDAHSLYLESLAELGLVGVLLIVIVLSIPLVAPRGSREPVLAAARGAYCAFLVHAAFEWDWEMPIVTLPALALGVALLLSRSGSRVIRVAAAARLGAATVVVLLTLFAVDALAGNAYLVAAERRALTGDNASAEARARHATRLLPWASEPWLVIADARAGAGDAAGTRDALRKAAARDPSDWLVWYRIAASSNGIERTVAVRRISLLNPRLVRRR
jgi:hypothetical protein